MKASIFMLLLLWGQVGFGQSPIVNGEWFVDDDPGIGLAKAFAGVAADTNATLSAELELSDYSEGMHTWYARVQDEAGVWSHTLAFPFWIRPRDMAAPIQRLEWFWDTDPGFGKANTVEDANGISPEVLWPLAISSLSPGIHQLFMRVRNAEGIWSHTYTRSVWVKAEPDAQIEKIEYYFRDSLGVSDTFTYTLSAPRHYLDMSFDLIVDSLIGGRNYEVCLAAIREDGKRSFEKCLRFFWESTVGIKDFIETSPLKIYPNPGKTFIHLEIPISDHAQLSIFDMKGTKVLQKLLHPGNGGPYEVDIRLLPTGIYMLFVETRSRIFVGRLVVK